MALHSIIVEGVQAREGRRLLFEDQRGEELGKYAVVVLGPSDAVKVPWTYASNECCCRF